MESKLRLAIASDHAGYGKKEELKKYLLDKGHEVTDFGTNSEDSCDYPDFAHPLATAVDKGEYDLGITLCYTGNGINMTANKHKMVRSAICWTVELAKLARLHNDANVCAMPAGFISLELAKEIVDAFLTTGFEGGRHLRRINKIPE